MTRTEGTGHELARQLITKHGTDRYPDHVTQLLKVTEEVGELAGAILKGHDLGEVAKEYADVGLALYALGDKLGLDLDEMMRLTMARETRTFAGVTR
jgi:NTP pyrophosphatase (non-canonical NTP hydrolase)